MATEVVVQNLRRVTEVVVVETMTVTTDPTTLVDGTRRGGNETFRVGNETLQANGDEPRSLNNTQQLGNNDLRTGIATGTLPIRGIDQAAV